MDFKSSSLNGILLWTIVAAGLFWFLAGFSGEQKPQMTQVGGKMNHCTCTQRLER